MHQTASKSAKTSQKLIRVGVVGIGFGQRVLVPAFRLNARCSVKAVCASTHEGASAVAGRLNIEHSSGNWRELMREDGIEAVAIATPAAIQAEIALEALRHGKHVFLEKPVAASVEQARALLDTAEQVRVAHVVDFEFPELYRWRKAKQLLEQGKIGKLRHASITWNVETFINKTTTVSWKADAAAGGGALNNLVSHVLHYLEWFVGPIARLSCTLSSAPGDSRPADTIVSMSLLTQSGISISVSVCCCAFMGCGHRIEFYGDDGTLMLINSTADHARGYQLFYGTRSASELKEDHDDDPLEAEGEDGRIAPVAKLVDRFVSWIDDGVAASPSLREGWRVQELIELARQSSLDGRQVDAGFVARVRSGS